MSNTIEEALILEKSGKWEQSKAVLQNCINSFHGYDLCDAILRYGKIEKYFGHFEEANKYLNKAIECASKNDLTDLLLESKLQRAIVWQYMGKYRDSITEFNDLKKSTKGSNYYIYSHCLMQLGILNRIKGNLQSGLKELDECFIIKSRLNLHQDAAAAKEQMGIIYERQGNIDKALTCYEDSLKLKKRVNYKRGYATYYLRVGVALMKLGVNDSAKYLFRKSLSLRKKIGDNIGIASSYYEIGKSMYLSSNMKLCINYLQQSLEIRISLNDIRRTANSSLLLGKALLRNNESIVGLHHVEKAIEIYKSLDLRIQLFGALSDLNDYYLKNNDALANQIQKEIKKVNNSLSKEQKIIINTFLL